MKERHNHMNKKVLCVCDYHENGKELWSQGNYYELLETYEYKNKDDNMYHLENNDGDGYVFGDDFNLYFTYVNDDIVITKEILKQMQPLMDALKIRCTAILKWKDKNDPEELIWKRSYIDHGISDEEFCFDENTIQFQIHETWAYGGSEYHYYTIPFTEILSDDWHDDFIKQVKEMKIQKEAEKIQKEYALKERQKISELAEYKRLKEKFENSEEN